MDERVARVSVVIPSVGRPSLAAAVASALGQKDPPLEVVVVLDSDRRPDGLPDDPRVRLVRTGGGTGPSGARALGVQHSAGDLVAFLDDDDIWEPGKLGLQIAEHDRLVAQGARPLVSCRARIVLPHQPDRSPVAPARAYRPGDGDVGDYLFTRHSLSTSGFTVASSTLLCSRALATEVPWRPDLRLHEDWDWVLRVSRQPGAVLSVLPEPLVRYLQAPPAAVTASRPVGGWAASSAWARSAGLSRRALGDFLLTVPAAQAVQQRRRGAALRLAGQALRQGRPGPAALASFALQVLLPAGPLRALARVADRRRAAAGT